VWFCTCDRSRKPPKRQDGAAACSVSSVSGIINLGRSSKHVCSSMSRTNHAQFFFALHETASALQDSDEVKSQPSQPRRERTRGH